MPVAKTYDTEHVMSVIREELGKSSFRRLAAEKGVSSSFLADVVYGRTPISESLAQAFGFIREVTTEVTFRKAS
jgi:hypothetical protein